MASLSLYNQFQIAPSSTSHAIFLVLQQILFLHDSCELLYLHQGTALVDSSISVHNFDIFQLSAISAGARTLTLYAPNVTYPRHNDIHRHTPSHCAVGIFQFNNFTISEESLQPWLFDTITPRYGPVIRKDEDHFIFLAPTQSVADTALLSPKFGEKIKYKLALYPDSRNDKVTCQTIDFYAKEGEPLKRVLKTFEARQNGISKSVSFTRSFIFPDMTQDFNGHMFRITVPNVKYRFEMEWRNGAYHPKRGFYKWWFDEAVKKFNFTYVMFWSSFGKATGKPLANGTWVGAAGDLLYDRADIAVIVGETYSRQPFFGFSAVLSYEWFFFMTHKPRNTYSPNAIFWPFSPLMWALFFTSLILMTFTLKFVSQMGTDPKVHGNIKWTYSRMFEYIFITFMEQDRDGPLNTSSIRMLCAFWLLFAMIPSTAYRGALVSLIAFPVDSWIPTTFSELANSNFKVALNNVGKVGAAYDVFSSSTNPVFQAIFNKMEMIGQPELCLKKAMDEDLCCIIWEGIVQYANARNISDKFGYAPMVQAKDIGLFIRDGFTYERRAIFRHHMDRTIEAALQMGLTIKWLQMDKDFIWQERKQWEEANNKAPVYYDRYEGPQKLEVSQFTGVLALSLIGLSMASAQLIAEFFKFRKENLSEAINQDQQDTLADDVILGNKKGFVVRVAESENDGNNNSGRKSHQTINTKNENDDNISEAFQ